jgi:hypothetical protein
MKRNKTAKEIIIPDKETFFKKELKDKTKVIKI